MKALELLECIYENKPILFELEEDKSVWFVFVPNGEVTAGPRCPLWQIEFHGDIFQSDNRKWKESVEDFGSVESFQAISKEKMLELTT